MAPAAAPRPTRTAATATHLLAATAANRSRCCRCRWGGHSSTTFRVALQRPYWARLARHSHVMPPDTQTHQHTHTHTDTATRPIILTTVSGAPARNLSAGRRAIIHFGGRAYTCPARWRARDYDKWSGRIVRRRLGGAARGGHITFAPRRRHSSRPAAARAPRRQSAPISIPRRRLTGGGAGFTFHLWQVRRQYKRHAPLRAMRATSGAPAERALRSRR